MLENWKKIKVIYVAGPFRGKTSWEMECNIRKAETLALEVWKLDNAAALCPHANTRYYQYEAKDEVWLDGDLAMLIRCDACLMTDDWERSEGATEEHSFCKKYKIPVFYDLKGLKDWLVTSSK